jgi:hypothetical protein
MPEFGQNKTAVNRRFRDLINQEREKRITQGVDVTIPGRGVVALQGRPEDVSSLQGLAFGAQLRLSMNDATPMAFRDRNDVTHMLSPQEVLLIWKTGADYISQCYKASWDLKELDPNTTDISGSPLWP